ncbi:LOW QUALITY PROTEIN: meiotic recombination protein REC114 [Perognathus longimembris pacificus]|uniref:LOW QUALITY PROTEIN: meiotic recombination protein REC114 n=1 Tax=Perognathus longimembris pacificus TaxID=214514 RepID=UPI0020191BA0|nr:LOW QUALITY PROTEIN: meiotic recombination protein REC114 [Perognathus longimembris pacificus]
MAAGAGKVAAGLGLPGEVTQWPLQRYGRFMLSGPGESPGPGPEAAMASSPTWKVFDSSEASGCLVLTIVISGHIFISQGETLLEGFSLIGSKNWLKIVRRMDCLLFGTTIKDKSRMFRVQFAGDTKEAALERCGSCVRSLAPYVTVEAPGGPEPRPGGAGGEEEPGVSRLAGRRAGRAPGSPSAGPPAPLTRGPRSRCSPAGTGGAAARTSVARLAQSLLASEELGREASAWRGEELGPFLRLCLLDRNFPAFVEEVEKELRKLAGPGD